MGVLCQWVYVRFSTTTQVDASSLLGVHWRARPGRVPTMAKGETMGNRLKRLREAAGLSQPKLAKAACVPVGTLRNWEQDQRVPRLDTAFRVAKALGVSLDLLADVMVKRKPRGPK